LKALPAKIPGDSEAFVEAKRYGRVPLADKTIEALGPGEQVSVTATRDGPASVALLGGEPAEGPILFSGPFVMDTPERLAQAKHDFASGKMGRLDGVPF